MAYVWLWWQEAWCFFCSEFLVSARRRWMTRLSEKYLNGSKLLTSYLSTMLWRGPSPPILNPPIMQTYYCCCILVRHVHCPNHVAQLPASLPFATFLQYHHHCCKFLQYHHHCCSNIHTRLPLYLLLSRRWRWRRCLTHPTFVESSDNMWQKFRSFKGK